MKYLLYSTAFFCMVQPLGAGFTQGEWHAKQNLEQVRNAYKALTHQCAQLEAEHRANHEEYTKLNGELAHMQINHEARKMYIAKLDAEISALKEAQDHLHSWTH